MFGYFIYRHAWRYALAPDKESQLTDSQCKALLKNGGWMIRNTFDFDCNTPTDFWYLIKESYGGMEELTKNNRQKIRKAFRLLEFKLVDKSLIAEKGYEITQKTYDGYRIKDRRMNKRIFNDLLQLWDEKTYDFWGFFDRKDGRLIGFCVIKVFDDCCLYDTVCVLPEYKYNKSGVYYGKYHITNEYYLKEKHFKYVFDGTRTITEHSNIQEFLVQNFNFRRAYCKLQIKYKWWFGIVVRLLLPFRKIIKNRNVRAVLNMHLMQS